MNDIPHIKYLTPYLAHVRYFSKKFSIFYGGEMLSRKEGVGRQFCKHCLKIQASGRTYMERRRGRRTGHSAGPL